MKKIARIALALICAAALSMMVVPMACAATSRPAKASISKVKASSNTKVKVTVKKVKGAKGYQIRVSAKKSMASAKTATSKKRTLSVKGLRAGTKYFAQARAYKTNGSKKVYGKWSAKKTVVTKYLPNPASDFQYKVGSYIYEGEVVDGDINALNKTTTWSDEKGRYEITQTVVNGIGATFSVKEETKALEDNGCGTESSVSVSGGGTDSANCGYGIYITNYKGSSLDVIVPESINGIPVVYFDYDDKTLATSSKAYNLDLNRCTSLVYTYLWGHFSKVRFPDAQALRNVVFGKGRVEGDIDLSGIHSLEEISVCAGSSWDGVSFETDSLRKVKLVSCHGVSLTNAKKLEEIDLSYCKLDNVDYSVMTNLRNLNLYAAEGVGDLDLTNCTALQQLNVGWSDITSLRFVSLPELQTLGMADAYIVIPNLYAMPKLECIELGEWIPKGDDAQKLLNWLNGDKSRKIVSASGWPNLSE